MRLKLLKVFAVIIALEIAILLGAMITDWNNDILFDDEFWNLNYQYFIHIYSDYKINIYNHSALDRETETFESFTDFENSLK